MDIKVFGHPRSGTHYVAALIDKNFYDGTNYTRFYHRTKPHVVGSRAVKMLDNNPDMFCVYVWRTGNDVLRSVFNMRGRFGLDEDNYAQFLKRWYSSMWKPNKKYRIKVNLLRKTKFVNGKVSGHFRKIKMVPMEYWEYHINFWFDLAADRPNRIKLICYDSFKTDFYNTMKELSESLGFKKNSFEDIGEQVGWIPQKLEG